MAITIGGLAVTSFSVTKKDDGKTEIRGNYNLVSNTGTILAKQGFNGYNEIVLDGSPRTRELWTDLMNAIRMDLTKTLGLEA